MKTFELPSLGTISSYEHFRGWWKSNKTFVPLLQRDITFSFMNLRPKVDTNFLEKADRAIHDFLNLNDRTPLNTQLCAYFKEYCQTINNESIINNAISTNCSTKLWEVIHPYKVFVSQRTKDENDIYIIVSCECDWEEEDGIQLVFKKGTELTRISLQDGYLTDNDALCIPDSDFLPTTELE
ncbi:DUF6985 domain-containing protein [Sediminitomix flava]|uniref:DUF6985 domain-containing protein n=1 Tax=Sediminitomix flava TaxID=379075 RepID=A0A315ZFD2_SEDFL|nr:hypothetical protein [Sediminitomix flava]PWJ44032.1 hypothetical protein BC781_101382 [Sediminitomix flava]